MAALIKSVLVSLPATILVVEAVFASPIIKLVRALAAQSRKSLRLLGNARVSDHWKERILPVYALKIFRDSMLILGCLICFFALYALGLYAGAWIFGEEFSGLQELQRADYMLSSLLSAFAYVIVRRFVHNV